MRKIAVLSFFMASSFAFAKVEDKPLITPEIMTERWVNAWTKSDEGLAVELQQQRAMMLRVIHRFLTSEDGAHWMILMREEPDSELADAVTDLVRMNTGIMRELTLDQFLMELAFQGDLIYQRGRNLSESGVTLPAMKDALRIFLRDLKSKLGTTVLKVNMEDLRLSSDPSPEYRLIFKHLITMLRQENVTNFRVVASMSPDAWEFILDTHQLMSPLYDLEDQERLQIIDGSKLEIWQSCSSLLEIPH